MDHVARTLGKDVNEIRRINLYKSGALTHYLQPVDHWFVPEMWTKLCKSAAVAQRQEAAAAFNRVRRVASLRWVVHVAPPPRRFPLCRLCVRQGAVTYSSHPGLRVPRWYTGQQVPQARRGGHPHQVRHQLHRQVPEPGAPIDHLAAHPPHRTCAITRVVNCVAPRWRLGPWLTVTAARPRRIVARRISGRRAGAHLHGRHGADHARRRGDGAGPAHQGHPDLRPRAGLPRVQLPHQRNRHRQGACGRAHAAAAPAAPAAPPVATPCECGPDSRGS